MTKQDFVHNVMSAPPVTVAGMKWFGYPVSDWVSVLAGLWLLLQIIWWLYTKAQVLRERKKNEQEGGND